MDMPVSALEKGKMTVSGAKVPTYERGDYVKVDFPDEATRIGEWMWVRVESCDDDKRLMFGVLKEMGFERTGVKAGSKCWHTTKTASDYPTLESSLRPVQSVPNYLGVSPRFASSCTDFVVADLSIVDLADRSHAVGGFVICLANTR